MPPDCLEYLVRSLAWSAVWLILGFAVMTAYTTKGHL